MIGTVMLYIVGIICSFYFIAGYVQLFWFAGRNKFMSQLDLEISGEVGGMGLWQGQTRFQKYSKNYKELKDNLSKTNRKILCFYYYLNYSAKIIAIIFVSLAVINAFIPFIVSWIDFIKK